ncbi:HEAT repeat domain-containing protein [bacterium]|nr:HEAT repeat domain-containing protein [bacterium]
MIMNKIIVAVLIVLTTLSMVLSNGCLGAEKKVESNPVELLDILDGGDPPEVIVSAFDALVSMGSGAVPYIIEDSRGMFGAFPAQILREIGSEAIEPLIQIFGLSDDPVVKESVIIGLDSPEVANLLQRELESEYPEVRIAVYNTLRVTGIKNDEIIQSLIKVLDSQDTREIEAAAYALGKLAEDGDQDVIDILNNVLQKNPFGFAHNASLSALYDLGYKQTEIFQMLEQNVLDVNSTKKNGAMRAVAIIGNSDSVELLAQVALDSNNFYRSEAIRYLGMMAPDPDALKVLIEAIKDDDHMFLLQLMMAFNEYGPNGRDALPALNELKEDTDSSEIEEIYSHTLEFAIFLLNQDKLYWSTRHRL